MNTEYIKTNFVEELQILPKYFFIEQKLRYLCTIITKQLHYDSRFLGKKLSLHTRKAGT